LYSNPAYYYLGVNFSNTATVINLSNNASTLHCTNVAKSLKVRPNVIAGRKPSHQKEMKNPFSNRIKTI